MLHAINIDDYDMQRNSEEGKKKRKRGQWSRHGRAEDLSDNYRRYQRPMMMDLYLRMLVGHMRSFKAGRDQLFDADRLLRNGRRHDAASHRALHHNMALVMMVLARLLHHFLVNLMPYLQVCPTIAPVKSLDLAR